MILPRLILPLAAVLLAAMVQTAAANPYTWRCSNGQRYTAVYDNDRLVLSNRSVRYTLFPRQSGSGSLYAGAGVRFHEKGRNAVMAFPGGGQITCTRGQTAARPGGALPAPGQSYGGIVRAGPSRSSARVGALREGEPVTILADTGVVWNNYRWFRIRFRGRRIGYQWGGILCARRAPIPGIYKVCP